MRAERTLRARRSLRSLFALCALCSRRTRWPHGSLLTLRPIISLNTLHACDTDQSSVPGDSLRPHRPGGSLGPLWPLLSCDSLRTRSTLRSSRTLRSLGSLISTHALRPLRARRARRTLRTLRALRPLSALRTLSALRSLSALRTLISLNSLVAYNASRSLLTHRTSGTLEPDGSKRTLCALCARRTCRPRGAHGSCCSWRAHSARRASVAGESWHTLWSLWPLRSKRAWLCDGRQKGKLSLLCIQPLLGNYDLSL